MVARSDTSRENRQEGSIEGIVENLQERGFIGEFMTIGLERMRCGACREELAASEVRMHDMLRVDVTTDPDDQAVVAALECPRCGAWGTRVFSYGPMASAEDSSCFAALQNVRP